MKSVKISRIDHRIMSADGTTIYEVPDIIEDQYASSLYAWDIESKEIIYSGQLPFRLRNLILNSSGKTLYATGSDGDFNILAINTDTFSLNPLNYYADNIDAVAISHDNRTLYVVDLRPRRLGILLIDSEKGNVYHKIPISANEKIDKVAIAPNPQIKDLYFTSHFLGLGSFHRVIFDEMMSSLLSRLL